MRDLTGEKFGRLTVVGPGFKDSHDYKWKCRCSCGKVIWLWAKHIKYGHTTSCGCLKLDLLKNRKGPNHPKYKGGWVGAGGYRFQKIDGKDVLEHRYIMSQILGRPLFTDERVHHINGVKTDNRPENLELWVINHPTGQRVKDLLAWAQIITARYSGDYAPQWGAIKK